MFVRSGDYLLAPFVLDRASLTDLGIYHNASLDACGAWAHYTIARLLTTSDETMYTSLQATRTIPVRLPILELTGGPHFAPAILFTGPTHSWVGDGCARSRAERLRCRTRVPRTHIEAQEFQEHAGRARTSGSTKRNTG